MPRCKLRFLAEPAVVNLYKMPRTRRTFPPALAIIRQQPLQVSKGGKKPETYGGASGLYFQRAAAAAGSASRPAALPCERLSRKQIMKLMRIFGRRGGNPAFPGLQTVSYNGKIICLKIRAEARDIWRHRNYV